MLMRTAWAVQKMLRAQVLRLPRGLTSIGDGAFEGCYSIGAVAFPDGLWHIGSHAFWDCDGLHVVRIPASVESIADDAFGGCDNLLLWVDRGSAGQDYAERLGIPYALNTLEGDWQQEHYLYQVQDGTATMLSYGNYHREVVCVPSRLGGYPVGRIAESAFADHGEIKSIFLPRTVTEVGRNAFAGCSRMMLLGVIGDGVDIDPDAFAGLQGQCKIMEIAALTWPWEQETEG